jgi:hypothetical protein
MKKITNLFRDSVYDHRKVLNSEELIKTAKDMGNRYEDLAKICGVSKTMISHWGNLNRPEKPTYKQLEPMFEKNGRGRFNCELEALSPAAVEYKPVHQYLAISMLLGLLFLGVWFVSWKPCAENWKECQKLPWYKMGFYQMIKNTESIEEFKEWKRSKGVANSH